ncbi:PREDICTED: F-box [Prunus dulcis]|uniref:PREDICTED: F-box n=1 Tax=Prunus dulcis TaxID=3755 RepID=A0A5E4FIN3_PRUDU|nr:PREDICTED: F-box [Prunus dulcis]
MYQAIANKRNPCLILHCDSPIQNNLHFVESSQIRHHEHYTNNVRRINAQIRYVAPEFHVVEVAFGFGFHPTTMEYKIVWISYLNNTYQGHQLPLQSRVQVLTLGSNAWRISVFPRCKLEQGSSEALVNGNLHWVTTRHKHRPGGCLSAVVCHDDGKIDIWMMKEYGSKESWTKEYVIGESLFRSLRERRNSRPSSRIWKRPTLSKDRSPEIIFSLCYGCGGGVAATALLQVMEGQPGRLPCVLANITVRDPRDSYKIPFGRSNR